MSQAALECEIQRGIERGWQVPRGEKRSGHISNCCAYGRRQAARCGTQARSKIDCASGRTGLAEYQQSLRRFRGLLQGRSGSLSAALEGYPSEELLALVSDKAVFSDVSLPHWRDCPAIRPLPPHRRRRRAKPI